MFMDIYIYIHVYGYMNIYNQSFWCFSKTYLILAWRWLLLFPKEINLKEKLEILPDCVCSEHQEYFWIDHFKPGSPYPSLVCQRRFPDMIVSDQLTVIAIKNQKLCLTCRLNIRNNSGRARMHLGTRVIKLCIKYKRYLTCLSHGCVFCPKLAKHKFN